MDMCVVTVNDGEHIMLAAMGDRSEVGSRMYFRKLYFHDFCASRSVINKVWSLSSWTMTMMMFSLEAPVCQQQCLGAMPDDAG